MAFGSYDEALVILNRIVTRLIDDSGLDYSRKSERLHALNGAIEAIQSAWDSEQELFAERMSREVDSEYFYEGSRGYGTRYEE